MLAIRMQRTGRSGHAQFRVIVQDSQFSPKSGRVVAYLGSYNPHTKVASLDAGKAAQYLQNGARPSDRAAKLLEKEGVKLPSWVKPAASKQGSIRHPEKLRKNRPAEEEKAEVSEEAPEEVAETKEEAPEAAAEEAKATGEEQQEAEAYVAPEAEAEPPAEEVSKDEPQKSEQK